MGSGATALSRTPPGRRYDDHPRSLRRPGAGSVVVGWCELEGAEWAAAAGDGGGEEDNHASDGEGGLDCQGAGQRTGGGVAERNDAFDAEREQPHHAAELVAGVLVKTMACATVPNSPLARPSTVTAAIA